MHFGQRTTFRVWVSTSTTQTEPSWQPQHSPLNLKYKRFQLFFCGIWAPDLQLRDLGGLQHPLYPNPCKHRERDVKEPTDSSPSILPILSCQWSWFPSSSCLIYPGGNNSPRIDLSLLADLTQRQDTDLLFSPPGSRPQRLRFQLFWISMESCLNAAAWKSSRGADCFIQVFVLGNNWLPALQTEVSKDQFLKFLRTLEVTIFWPLIDQNEPEYQKYLDLGFI